MRRIAAPCLALLPLTGAAIAYANGRIDVPEVCDPADTRLELSGQWGAKLFGGNCFDSRASSVVVVRDNDYAFQRNDCVVFATRSAASVQIQFQNPHELLITTAAAPEDDLASLAKCGPVQVLVQRD